MASSTPSTTPFKMVSGETMVDRRDQLKERASTLIDELSDGGRNDRARDSLICDMLAWQAEHVEPYARLVAARKADPERARHPDELPAVPTDVFRYARVAAHDATEDRRTFRTSGTTQSARGSHGFRDLELYDRAARAAARHALFHGASPMRLIVLASPESHAPDSSLSYMLSRFAEWFGRGETTWVLAGEGLDMGKLQRALASSVASGEPVALLGTSFAFVHAEDALEARFTLPTGSRIMQTGGFKGRSREVAPDEMRALLATRYGVAEHAIIAEYGMTELSSQMYESTLSAPNEERRLWVPGWLRATPVDPETLVPVHGDDIGILRLDDVANIDSACAVQTSDLARRVGDGIEVLGRAVGSTPRGCSLAVDAALSGGGQS